MITSLEKEMLRRSELLLGSKVMARIAEVRVIIFGVGGVGSWCAESLIRNGVRHLTIVDSDCVAVTNCNRQLMAMPRTIGQVKVLALRERLLEINPQVEILALQQLYSSDTAASFQLETYDFIIDCIDALTDKAALILHATSLPRHITFFSSMGAALRIDPFKVRRCEFWQIQGDALARALRNKFKKQKTYPRRKFICVCSDEVPLPNQNDVINDDAALTDLAGHHKVQVNGSISHVTSIFGFSLAGLVIQTIVCQIKTTKNLS